MVGSAASAFAPFSISSLITSGAFSFPSSVRSRIYRVEVSILLLGDYSMRTIEELNLPLAQEFLVPDLVSSLQSHLPPVLPPH